MVAVMFLLAALMFTYEVTKPETAEEHAVRTCPPDQLWWDQAEKRRCGPVPSRRG